MEISVGRFGFSLSAPAEAVDHKTMRALVAAGKLALIFAVPTLASSVALFVDTGVNVIVICKTAFGMVDRIKRVSGIGRNNFNGGRLRLNCGREQQNKYFHFFVSVLSAQ